MAWISKTDNKDTTYKEQILARVRNAVIERPEAMFKDIDKRSDTWIPIKEEDGTAITFVQHFQEQDGIFVYLESEDEFAECIRQLAPQNGWEPLCCTSPTMQAVLKRNGIAFTTSTDGGQKLVCLTDCEFLVAQTGSIVVSDAMTQTRAAYSDPDVLLVFATTGQIVGGLKDAFAVLRMKYGNDLPRQISFITGPSRCTDIEQTPVVGACGIRQVAVFLVQE